MNKHVLDIRIKENRINEIMSEIVSIVKDKKGEDFDFVINIWFGDEIENDGVLEAGSVLNTGGFFETVKTITSIFRAYRVGYEEGWDDGKDWNSDKKLDYDQIKTEL